MEHRPSECEIRVERPIEGRVEEVPAMKVLFGGADAGMVEEESSSSNEAWRRGMAAFFLSTFREASAWEDANEQKSGTAAHYLYLSFF